MSSSSTSPAQASQADASSSSTAAHPAAGAGDGDDEVVLPNMVPAEDDSGKLYYFQFPPWPKQPGMLRIDQFESQGLVNQSWPAGTFKPEAEGSSISDEEDSDAKLTGLDGSGFPTVDLDIEHFADRKEKRKNRPGRKRKKPRAPRMQMLRKGIVRTEDLFGPGGWDGPELVETRGKEPYDVTTPALTRIQRAAREYASSRVHVINAEQTLMQIWANFLAFAQVDKRPVVEQKPPQDDDDAFDSGSDGFPEDGQIMYHPEEGLDDEDDLPSRFLDDMVGTVRMFLSSVYQDRGLHWHDTQLNAGPQVVWSFVKYVRAHGVLMEPSFADDFAGVQAICEQARQEMNLTKATPVAFEDGFNTVCSRVWGRKANETNGYVWPEDVMTAAASQLDNLDLTDSDTASVEGSRTFDDPDGSADGSSSAVDMLPPRPTSSSGIDTPALTDHDAATSAASASEVQTLDAEPALEWQIPLPIPVAGQIPATHHERSMPISDWAATQKPGWELEWDVSEYTICQPMSFLEPILGGGVRDAEWAVAAEQEAIMRIGPVGDAAAGLPGVSGHFLLGNAAHSLAPVILEYWEPVPAPFAEPIGTVADEAYLPSTAGGGAKRLVVWMESTVVTAKQIKPGMGGVFELKWVRRRGQAFWFVDKVHVCFSDFWLAAPSVHSGYNSD